MLWPVKLALYGSDWFRSGGSDTGLGGGIFDLLTYAFFVWALVLLVLGIRAVHGWTWSRAAAATGLALVLPACGRARDLDALAQLLDRLEHVLRRHAGVEVDALLALRVDEDLERAVRDRALRAGRRSDVVLHPDA